MKKIFLTAALLTCSSAISYVQAELSYAYAQERLERLDKDVVQERGRVLLKAFITLANEGRCEVRGSSINLLKDAEIEISEELKIIVEFMDIYKYTYDHDASLERRRGVEYLKMAVFMQAFQELLKRLHPGDLASIRATHSDHLQRLGAQDPQACAVIQGLLEDPYAEPLLLPGILERCVQESVFAEGVPLRASPARRVLFRSVASILGGMYIHGARASQEPRSHRSEEAQLWESYAAGDAQLFTAQLGQLLAHKADVGFLNSVLRKIALSPVQWSVDPTLTQILSYLDDWFFNHAAIPYKACVDYKVNGLTILDEVVDQFKTGAFGRTGFRDRISWLQRKGAEMTDHVRAVAAADATVKKILNVYGYH